MGKQVHSTRSRRKRCKKYDDTVNNYHPISVRSVDVTHGTMVAGYSDGVVRVWPMEPFFSWEDYDLFFVFLTNIGYFVLFAASLIWIWRAPSMVKPVLASFAPCGKWRRPLRKLPRRRLILDHAIAGAIDVWAALLFLQFLLLVPPRAAIKEAWRLKPSAFKREEPDAFRLEVVDTYWIRLEHHFIYLDAMARFPTERLRALCGGLQTRCRDALYGGHRSGIVGMEAYGTRLHSVCSSGVVCEWDAASMTKIVRQWNCRPNVSCMRFFALRRDLVTLWLGTSEGHLDVRILGTGSLLAEFHEDREIRQKFEELDADDSGSLDREELAVLIKDLLVEDKERAGKHVKEGSNRLKKIERQAFGMAGEVLVQMDDDNSGAIDYDEFSYWWKDYRTRSRKGMFGGLFGKTSASHGGSRGAVRCMTLARVADVSYMYVGWEEGSILKMKLSKPDPISQNREVEVDAELKGHVKPVEDVVLHQTGDGQVSVIYSRSKTRVLAHSFETAECLVSFNDAEEDRVSDFVFLKESMFMAHNSNVLVWDLNASLHRKDPMGLNDVELAIANGQTVHAKAAKLQTALEGHSAQVTSLKLTSKSLFTGSADGTTREWKHTQPWEVVNVFDSTLDRVESMVATANQIYCSYPDGHMRGWTLGSGVSTEKEKKKKVNAAVSATLGKLFGGKPAIQDVTHLTSGPESVSLCNLALSLPVHF